MDDAAPAPGQVYLSGWPKRLVTSGWLPRPLLLAIARSIVDVRRRHIRRRDQLDAATVPLPAADDPPVLYFADIYHGGVTFWDWVVLRGGGLWWAVIWPLVIKTSIERLATHAELRTVLELDAHTYEELARHKSSDIDALRNVIALGRMEIVNGTYAQPLALTIGGEANVRHFFYGLETIARVLRAPVRSFVAGEPQFFPQLPQVLAGFGIENVVPRTHWAPFGTDPAADAEVVRWQGPDGSVVRAVPRYGCMDYRLALEGHPGVQNAGLSGDDFEQWSGERIDAFVAEAARRGIQRPFLTRLADPKPPESPFPQIFAAARRPGSRLTTVAEYCALPRADEPPAAYGIDDIPSTIPWGLAGEQLHREQARAESAVLIAERLDAIALALGAPGHQERLDTAWKLLLRSQHHDLHLCSPWHSTAHGKSMGQVGCDFAQQGGAQAQAVTAVAMEALAERFSPATITGSAFLLFNPAPWPRRELVQLPAGAGSAEVWQRGVRLAAQAVTDDAAVAFVVDLPPLGVDVVEVRPGVDAPAARTEPVELAPSEDVVAGALAPIDLKGGFLTVWKDGRFQRSAVERISIEDGGAVYRRYRIEGRVADLPFTQWITAIPALRRVQLTTEIDFGSGCHLGPQLTDHRADLAYYIQDDKKLCLNFESRLPKLFCDSPFLLVEPSAERLTSLSFVGLEGPAPAGVAILHKGTPGWQIDRDAGVLRNVLAWGPQRWLYASDDSITPGQSRYTAVHGRQRYEHAIVPTATRLDAIRAAVNFRLPVVAVDLPSANGSASVPWSFLDVAPEQAIVTALFARDAKTYCRLWNAAGEPTKTTLSGSFNRAVGVSLRLEEESAPTSPQLRPWGIHTVRLSQS